MTGDERVIMVKTCMLHCDKERGVHRKLQGLYSGPEKVALKLSEGGGNCGGEDHCH